MATKARDLILIVVAGFVMGGGCVLVALLLGLWGG
jgi:hypothetical protein